MHKTVIAMWTPGSSMITVRDERGCLIGNIYNGQVPVSVQANGSKVFCVGKSVTNVYECANHPTYENSFWH